MNTSAGWDSHASAYARNFAPLTSFVARAMLNIVDAKVPDTADILDIACGSGALAIPAAERAQRGFTKNGKGGLVVASDFSPGMVELAKAAAAARGLPPRVIRCDVQNGEALTFADESFDAVFSCFGIFLFGDRRAGWREASRVLRPGGTFVTSVWQGPQTNPMMRAQIVPIVQALPKHLVPSGAGGWTEIGEASALVSEVSASGSFTDVHTYPFHASITFPVWQLVWDALRENPIMGTLLAKCNATELEVVRESLFAHFRELAGGDDQPLVLESVCNILVATRAPAT